MFRFWLDERFCQYHPYSIFTDIYPYITRSNCRYIELTYQDGYGMLLVKVARWDPYGNQYRIPPELWGSFCFGKKVSWNFLESLEIFGDFVDLRRQCNSLEILFTHLLSFLWKISGNGYILPRTPARNVRRACCFVEWFQAILGDIAP